MSESYKITADGERLSKVCREYGVAQLWLFGSILRTDFGPDSDIDVLVRLQDPVGLFRLGGLEADLTDLFGRVVHLTSFNTVPDKVRLGLLRTAKLQYAA